MLMTVPLMRLGKSTTFGKTFESLIWSADSRSGTERLKCIRLVWAWYGGENKDSHIKPIDFEKIYFGEAGK
jgi:hypothetical protein